jgi:hypothetical protein
MVGPEAFSTPGRRPVSGATQLRRPHGLRKRGHLLAGSNGLPPVLAHDAPSDRYARARAWSFVSKFRAEQQRCSCRLGDMFTCS